MKRRDIPTDRIAWQPNPGPQTRFLSSPAFEVLYGGAAGGGKSAALLAGALRHVARPDYRAILFRRTFPELEKSLIDKSRNLYPRVFPQAYYNEQKKVWTFPSGALIYFGHLEHEQDVQQYQSAEFQYVGFDELTHFTRRQYRYMVSRCRSSSGIPSRVRAATNPGGPGADWVIERFGPWLRADDPDYDDITAKPGEVLYFITNGETDEDEVVSEGTPHALARTFIPAKVQDNPHLMKNDPGYVARLMSLDPVTRKQLLDGNWLAKAAPGEMFKRHMFRLLDVAPALGQFVRWWDRAATEPKKENKDPDWTVGLKMCRTPEGLYVVTDVFRDRLLPGKVMATIKATAHLDGVETMVALAKDPGQAGVFEMEAYLKELAGFNVRFFPETGNKVVRAQPASAQAVGGNMAVVKGRWNAAFFTELEAFPTVGVKDDQVDGLSGAFMAVSGAPMVDEEDVPKNLSERSW